MQGKHGFVQMPLKIQAVPFLKMFDAIVNLNNFNHPLDSGSFAVLVFSAS
jgi:hypothetical protein